MKQALVRLALLASVACALPLASFACGGEESNLPPPPPPPGSVTATPPATTSAASAAVTTPPPPPAPPPVLVLGTASPDPTAPLPVVKIAAPATNQVIPEKTAGDFAVKLDVKNWQTAMGSQHVHLILDNQPYKPIYDTKAPVKLSELTGGEALGEGQHVLVAFPGRANHESVKTKDALAIVSFWVGKKGETKVDVKKPMLIYSRPKGDYKGDQANHVLVDFQLANDTLAEGKDHVHITVTGPGIEKELSVKAEKFGPPYYLDNLQNGAYTLKLELMTGGADMKVIPGPWNSTTRTIHVDHEALPEAMPMPAASAAPSAAPSATPEHHHPEPKK